MNYGEKYIKMVKNLVIGAITHYEYEHVEPWVVSLERSGFSGIKALIVYNGSKELIQKLSSKGILTFGFKTDEAGNFFYRNGEMFPIAVERFVHMWYYLTHTPELQDINWVIATDVKDVVFQSNPMKWIEGNLPEFDHEQSIVVASEGIKYKDEPWSKNNMITAYSPILYEMMESSDIYCAGMIAGKKNYVADLFLHISQFCRGLPGTVPGGGGPDQSAMNILLNSRVYRNSTRKVSTMDNFCVHLGTTLPAIQAGNGEIGYWYVNGTQAEKDKQVSKLLDPQPIFEDGLVKNTFNKPFAIVHQYDRVPEWKEVIDKKYRE